MRERRDELDLTQAEAAKKCGLSLRSYQSLEDPSAETDARFESVLGVLSGLGISLEEIEKGSKPPPTPTAEVLEKLERLIGAIRGNPATLDALIDVVSGFEASVENPKPGTRRRSSV